MRIGIGAGPLGGGSAGLMGQVEEAAQAEADGFESLWFNHTMGVDSLIAVAMAGQRTERIELVTGVIPIYSRQPLLMAQQAMSANEAAGGRLTLGLGLAHPESVPLMWNSAYDRPARFMAEYLDVVLPLLDGEGVTHSGEMVTTVARLAFEGVAAPRVMLAALGPRMLELAGSRTDGTVLWVTGPKAIKSHIAPRLREAAERAGRGEPRIYAALPVCVTDDRDAARAAIRKSMGRYGRLVNYRRVLDIEGAEGAEDVALIGDEREVEEQLRELADAGATDFAAALVGLPGDSGEGVARGRGLLAGLAGRL